MDNSLIYFTRTLTVDRMATVSLCCSDGGLHGIIMFADIKILLLTRRNKKIYEDLRRSGIIVFLCLLMIINKQTDTMYLHDSLDLFFKHVHISNVQVTAARHHRMIANNWFKV